tara:strand:- start:2174 stop:3337 length:1164 start_codon:yes stop_codon:yes gene_type:complete
MLLNILILLIITYFLIELNHQFRIDSPLILKPKEFKKIILDSKQKYIALVQISNMHKRMEVMIPFFKVIPQLIGISKDELISIHTKIKQLHPEEEERKDDYWSAYIIKSRQSTFIEIEVELEIKNLAIEKLKCIWLDIEWGNYGPFGFFKRFDGFVLPDYLNISKVKTPNTNYVEPIKTHILGTLDDPINILKSYIPQNFLPTDILTIGESPLAIMQGKYLDYRSVNVSLVARIVCKGFHPTSSLATASGMQTLINISGPSRVIISFLIGGFCKSFGIKGVFYRLAGEQARLIDDITGTTPPYDKSIVLGPKDHHSFCLKASKELQVNVAVVDVNDLGKVKILSTNNVNNTEIIKKALSSNPAGNANQQTPIVLIRTEKYSSKSHQT